MLYGRLEHILLSMPDIRRFYQNIDNHDILTLKDKTRKYRKENKTIKLIEQHRKEEHVVRTSKKQVTFFKLVYLYTTLLKKH